MIIVKTILLLVVAVAAVLAVMINQQPDEFHITRSLFMKASPASIFPHINNLKNWQEWSPWAKLDPQAKNEFSGPAEGKDSALAWDGNNKVGKGMMTIIDSEPDNLIRFRLDFLKPMQTTNLAEFTLTPQNDGTLVTWSMSGTSNFIGKAISLIFNCDKMVGGQFEQGLADLKVIVESHPQ